MDMNLTDLKLLLRIGKEPFLDRDGLAEATGLSKRRVGGKLNEYRENTLVVKTVREDDRGLGLRWELTFKGRKQVHRALFELSGDLGVTTDPGKLHWHRPPHSRDEEYFAKIAALKKSQEITEELREKAKRAAEALS